MRELAKTKGVEDCFIYDRFGEWEFMEVLTNRRVNETLINCLKDRCPDLEFKQLK